ncbi:11813_t:CDS:2, partial [Diversispora eburnea]
SKTRLSEKSKKSKVSIQKEINITDLEENNTEKSEEDNYSKVNVTRYKGKDPDEFLFVDILLDLILSSLQKLILFLTITIEKTSQILYNVMEKFKV